MQHILNAKQITIPSVHFCSNSYGVELLKVMLQDLIDTALV